MNPPIIFIFLIFFAVLPAFAGGGVIGVKLPDVKPAELRPFVTISVKTLDEGSGIVKSRRHPGVYWTHNDSGDTARIFAVRRDGTPATSGDPEKYQGVNVPGAANVDWEDIASDSRGNLYIADTGNNSNKRRNLCLYVVPEPNPLLSSETPAAARYMINLPDQDAFPPEKLNFDLEAVFHARDKLYFLSKHRSDNNTKLYRMDSMVADSTNTLTLLGEFAIGGKVTAADATADGKKLAVLTYEAVWVFEVKKGDDYFNGRIYWLPIIAGQCEGITWDGDKLTISNEAGSLFEVAEKDLIKVRRK